VGHARDRLVTVRKPRPAPFKSRHFEPSIILCAVRWYLRYSLSYRDVEELVVERGLPVGKASPFGLREDHSKDRTAVGRQFLRSFPLFIGPEKIQKRPIFGP
jgi:hypothetical protein